MMTDDAAGGDMEAGSLVAAIDATQEGQLSQDSPSRHAPIQAAGEAQDAACASALVQMTERRETAA